MKFVHGAPGAPFPHYKEERFMMDSGYFGANHAWLPFKKSEDESSAHLGYATRDTDGSIRLCQMVDPSEEERSFNMREKFLGVQGR